MNQSLLLSPYDRWAHPSYERRVRVLPQTQPPASPTYLWGSAGIKTNIVFPKPPTLHIRNDLFGDAVTISFMSADGSAATIGTIEPGECVSIPLQGAIVKGAAQGLTGVYATCPTETVVACVIRD